MKLSYSVIQYFPYNQVYDKKFYLKKGISESLIEQSSRI